MPISSTLRFLGFGPAGDRSSDAYFHSFERYEEGEDNLQDILISQDFRLCQSPMRIYRNFKKSGVLVREVTPDVVLEFFRKFDFASSLWKIGNLPRPIKNTPFKSTNALKLVIQYCSDAEDFESKLIGCPLLLTQDRYLHVFRVDSPKFVSPFYDIVPHAAHEFVHSEFIEFFETEGMVNMKLLKEFEVTDFARLLTEITTEFVCQSEKTITFSELGKAFTSKKPHLRNTEVKQLISRVWSFLKSELCGDQKLYDIKQLGALHLLPVWSESGHSLYKICNANAVIMPNEDYTEDGLLDIVCKLGIPRLNIETMSGEDTKYQHEFLHVLECIVGKKLHLAAIIAAHIDAFGFDGTIDLDHNDKIILLKFLSQNYPQLKDQTQVRAIRKLPIFPAINGELIALNENLSFVIPESLPKAESDDWTNTFPDVKFLVKDESDPQLILLLDTLGCKQIDEVDIYSKFIFSCFTNLSDGARFEHLSFIKLIRRKGGDNDQKSKSLLTQLTHLPILYHSASKKLKCVSSFYDSRKQIFKVFELPSDFPPSPYNGDVWLNFLAKCGLVCEVTGQKLLEYARLTAKKYQEERAKLIVEKLMDENFLMDESIMSQLKLVKFIHNCDVPDEMSSLHPQFSQDASGCIAFFGSYKHTSWKLIWTVGTILPAWASAFNDHKHLARKLGVCENIPCMKVCEHLKNICDSFVLKRHENESQKYFTEAIHKIYSYLNKNIKTKKGRVRSDDDIVAFLQNVAFVSIDEGGQLARTSQVFVDIEKVREIRPYLFKFPTELGEFLDLFKFLGVQENPEFHHYAAVLQEIKNKIGDDLLNLNEKNAVQQAVTGILDRLSKLEKSNADSEEKTLVRGLEELILPGEDGRLYQSSRLVIKDNDFIAGRIKDFPRPYLVNLREFNANTRSNNVEKLLRLIPKHVQPTLLSSVVQERIDVAINKLQTSRIQTKLRSLELRESLLRLASDDTAGPMHETELIDGNEIVHRVERLATIKVYNLSALFTHLEYGGEEIAGSRIESSYFIDRSDTKTNYTVYYNSTLDDSACDSRERIEAQQLYTRLADVVNDVTGGLFQCRLNIIQLLLQCEPVNMSSTLDKMNIKQDCSPNIPSQDPYVPPLGSFVPIDMHHLLKQDLSLFEIGDIAALEIEDDESENPVYILVKIVQNVTSGGRSLLRAKYDVDTGEDGVKTVNATDLYAFFRSPPIKQCGNILQCGIPTQDFLRKEPTKEKSSNAVDILNQIKKMLKEASHLPEEQRKKIIKRLYLRWHPDKNPDNVDLCTRVFQKLLNLIARLDDGGVSSDEEHPIPTKRHKNNRDFEESREDSFHFDFKKFNDRARQHSRNQSRYDERFHERTSFFDSFRHPNPEEARRWIRQAEWDVLSARKDSLSHFYEWSCYKYHQVRFFSHSILV